MKTITEIIDLNHDNAEDRYKNFEIRDISSIKEITDKSYLEAPVWVGGDEKFACLFIDLDGSSKRSFKAQSRTMAKIYDYFTQTLFDIMTEDGIAADYVDIKGDGVFGIYEGSDAVYRAFVSAKTFSTFFDMYIRPKFQTEDEPMNFKAAIHVDKLLVRRIGGRGQGNNNEVWAGRLVNKAAKLAAATYNIYDKTSADKNDHGLLVVSHDVHQILRNKKKYTVMSCGHADGKPEEYAEPSNLWTEFDSTEIDDLSEDVIFYNASNWCKICGDEFASEILKS